MINAKTCEDTAEIKSVGIMMQNNKLTLAKTFQRIFRQNKRLGIKLIYHDMRRLIQFLRITIENAAKVFVKICKKAIEFLQSYMEVKHDSKGILTSSN